LVRLLPYASQRLGILRGGTSRFKPVGLAPQLVSESFSDWATGDTHQRKVMFNGSYFFVWHWNGLDGGGELWEKLSYSADGQTWTTNNLDEFSIGPGAVGHAGNYDVALFPNDNTQCYEGYIGSTDRGVAPYLGIISDVTISFTVKYGCAIVANSNANGGHICITPKPRYFSICHQYNVPMGGDFLSVGALNEGAIVCTTHEGLDLPDHSSTTGGAQMVPYKTASPWDCLIVLKDANDVLWWSLFRDSTRRADIPFTSLGVTLTSGFSSFCACSEAQLQGDPEKAHLVYIKSTGALCYAMFENNAFHSEKVLVASGVSYAVIAVGKGGKLYVFYVKDGKVWVIHRKGAWRNPVELFTGDHTYNNPAYLSTNQNVQNGKICLVWTEGTASPYEVWFCYLND